MSLGSKFIVITVAMTLMAMNNSQLMAAELRIAVASNFTDAIRNLVPLFEQSSGHQVKVSLGSTGKLFSQIVHGAPFEVFLAADAKRPEKAEREGLAITGSRFTYAIGKLVLWSAKKDQFGDGEAYLKSNQFTRAAIANPKTAPYGLAARQAMQKMEVWQNSRKKLVRGENIAQTFQFAATGNAEIGFVAYSQIKAWKKFPGSTWLIPEDYYAPIAQQAVLLKKGSTNPAAHDFIQFLKSAKVKELITSFGYGVE